MEVPPDDNPAYEVFPADSDAFLLCRKFLAEYKVVPGEYGLKSFAKSIVKQVSSRTLGRGGSQSRIQPGPSYLPTGIVAEFTQKLLKAFNGVTVVATDIRGVKVQGALRDVKYLNKRWAMEVHPDAVTRYTFTTDKAPEIVVSEEIAGWVRPV